MYYLLNFQVNKEQWLQRIEEFHSSGLTQVSWCQQQNVKISTLRYWLKKLREEEASGNTPEWVELQVTERVMNSSDASIKIHVGPYRVEISEGFAPSALLDVLKTLSVLC